MSWLWYGIVASTLLVAVLRRTSVWWIGGVIASVLGFVLLASGKGLNVLGGIALVGYGFLLLGIGSWLYMRFHTANEIPKATLRS